MQQASMIVRRILWSIPVLLVTILLTFAIIKPLPGSPFGNCRACVANEKVMSALDAKYGLDDPWYQQYGRYILNAAQGDLGPSLNRRNESVGEIIADRLPTSMAIGLLAILLAGIVGTFLGMIAAIRANGTFDHTITILTTLGFAIPGFVIATLWVHYMGYTWSITPIGGWGKPEHYIGPVVTLAISVMPYFVRVVRASMLEVLELDHVVFARSKGLSYRRTIVRHVMRMSIIPVIINTGPLVGYVLTGSFIIEYIFTVPGIAGAFVDSVTGRDYNLLLGSTVVIATIIIVLNLLADIAYTILDPRVRIQ